ncbi:hypothetical protein T07_15046 [Trichinella nelsoni]|uniref:Uncharacterized protein n=1 Tax=Trichinella nelsoni TaxID=6336 RepID=A0A0V0RGH9_9BILA|nr:hypothetical protein T07_15046 [Trichinella nelsoni]
MREEVGGVVGECQSSEYRDEIEVGGGEVGEEAVSVKVRFTHEANRQAGRIKCVVVTANAPWVRNLHMMKQAEFVGKTGAK